MTKNIHPSSAKELEGTIEISQNFESHDNMYMGKDLNPVNRGKDGNQRQMSEGINQPPDDPGESKNQMQQADNTDILIDKAEDDEYKHYESTSEEEIKEDQFHDVSEPHLDKDTNKVMENK